MKTTITQQLADVEVELSQANATIAQNETAMKELQTQVVSLTEAKTNLERDLANETNAHKDTQAALAKAMAEVEQLKASAQTAEQKAGEVLATVGVPPVEQVAAAVPTADELWAQYATITDPKAKNDFYNKHRDILTPKHAQAR